MTYWTQITVTLGLFATSLGFLTLYAYTRIIGRTDLFMPAIDVKSALIVWPIMVMILTVSYIFVFSATTWMYGCSISLFKYNQEDQHKISLILLVPTIIGFGAFVWTVFLSPDLLNSNISFLALLAITFTSCLATYKFTVLKTLIKKNLTLSRKSRSQKASLPIQNQKNTLKKYKFRRRIKNSPKRILNILKKKRRYAKKKYSKYLFTILCCFLKNKLQQNPRKLRSHEEYFFAVLLSLFISLTVSFAVFPTLLTIRAYLGEETPEAASYIAGISIFTLTLTLVPAIIFYRLKEDIYKRTLYGCTATILVFCIFSVVMPGAIGQITYIAAKNLAIRQTSIDRYVLREEFELRDLDGQMWKTRHLAKDKIEIEAFQLFSFGDILLLCPKQIKPLELKQLRHYTTYCISTLNSKVIRKPKLPTFAKKHIKILNCADPAWHIAGDWSGWEDQKKRLTSD
nr:hypothetical protein [Pseudomonas sp. MWU12-2037]